MSRAGVLGQGEKVGELFSGSLEDRDRREWVWSRL